MLTSFLLKTLSTQVIHANDVKVVTLLDKPSRREADVKAEFIGFEIPNEFVIGFGLDFNEKYRQLPYIGVLKDEVYS